MRDFKGMKRQRGRNRKPGGAGANTANPNRSWDSQGPENIKVRGNAQTVYERYMQLARDAAAGGDRVLAENYTQHAEHYFRVLRALQPARPVSEIAQRELAGQGFDIDFEDESGAQAAAILAAQQAELERQQRQQAGGGEWRERNGNGNGNGDRDRDREPRPEGRQEPRSESRPEPRADGEAEGEQPQGGRRETRRERWERRRDERNRRFDGDAPEAADKDGDRDGEDAAPVEREDDGASLPGFLTRSAAPAAVEPAPETAAEAPEAEKPAPRRRAPRRKAEAPAEEI